MQILHSASKFTRNLSHLKDIYNKFVRSKLETSSTVWHSSLNEKHKYSFERVQCSFFKIILKNKYISYENALELLNMDTLHDRREVKSLKFAKGCLNDKQMKDMFPLNRYQNSTIINLQKLLKDIENQRKIKTSVDKACSREARLQKTVVYLCDVKNNQ